MRKKLPNRSLARLVALVWRAMKSWQTIIVVFPQLGIADPHLRLLRCMHDLVVEAIDVWGHVAIPAIPLDDVFIVRAFKLLLRRLELMAVNDRPVWRLRRRDTDEQCRRQQNCTCLDAQCDSALTKRATESRSLGARLGEGSPWPSASLPPSSARGRA